MADKYAVTVEENRRLYNEVFYFTVSTCRLKTPQLLSDLNPRLCAAV